MKNILILGAGIYQVPLIRKAKEMGYRVLVCTIPGSYPGVSLADEVYYVDTTDKNGCFEIARQNEIVAVCTSGTDVALPTLGYIVDQLGLYGPSEKVAIYSSNKFLMKDAFLKGDVTTARYMKVTTLDECMAAAEIIGYPCVLKVVDSSGSRGIHIVNSKPELAPAFGDAHRFTKEDYVIIEEYLAGLEFGAQAFVYHGRVCFVMPHSDEVFHGATGVPIGHSVPLESTFMKYEKSIYGESVKAIQALDIDNTAVNIDFILANGKPYVLEVGARCGATGLAELVSLHYDIDFYSIMIEAAAGTLHINKVLDLKPKRAATVLLVTSEHSGTITSYQVPATKPYLADFSMDYEAGDHVRKFMIGPDRLGQVIVTADSVEESRHLAHKIIKEINLKVEPSNMRNEQMSNYLEQTGGGFYSSKIS